MSQEINAGISFDHERSRKLTSRRQMSAGDVLLVVESDKADMDFISYDDGYLSAILTPRRRQYTEDIRLMTK